MKVKAKLKEMLNADVTHISLVRRSATRMPIRVTKSDLQEPNMIDLNLKALGRVFKTAEAPASAAPAPVELVAVAIDQLSGDAEVVLKALKDAGIEFTRAVKSDEGVTTFSGDAELVPSEVSVIKVSPELALVVKGFSAYSDELAKSSFGEMANARGFWGGLRNATETLATKIETEMYSAANKGEAVQKADAMLKEFSTYVGGLLTALPEKAFKAEQVVGEAMVALKGEHMKGGKKKMPEDAKEGEGSMDKPKEGDMDESKKDKAKKEEGEGAAKVEKAAEPTLAEQIAQALAPLSQSLDAINTAMAETAKKVDTLGGELAQVKKQQEDAQKAVDSIARKAETAAQAVTSVVAAPPKGADSAAPGESVKKEDPDWRTGVFDTALHRRNF